MCVCVCVTRALILLHAPFPWQRQRQQAPQDCCCACVCVCVCLRVCVSGVCVSLLLLNVLFIADKRDASDVFKKQLKQPNGNGMFACHASLAMLPP